jgi:hypothetical protein
MILIIIIIIIVIAFLLILFGLFIKNRTKSETRTGNLIKYNKGNDSNYQGKYSGTYTYKKAWQTIAIMNIDFTYKNKNNILLNNVSFDKCKAFPHGKDILSDCTDKKVILNEIDSTIVGSCINTITSDNYIKNVKIYSMKLNFSEDKIETIDINLKVSIVGININDTFKITLTRSDIV